MKAVKRAAMLLVVGIVAGLAGPVGAATWVEITKPTASDGAANDWFGCSASVSGDLALVGAFGDDDNGNAAGSAYVFGIVPEPGSFAVLALGLAGMIGRRRRK